MATIWDYGITTPYGQVPGYPLNNGFHRGIDYGAPLNTSVTVNGVVIGLSGSTGASTGPHTHVGRWQNGTSFDPGVQGGKSLSNASVIQTGYDRLNGNFIRIQAEGFQWVYLHLNQINVKVGDIIGENMPRIENNDDWYYRMKQFMEQIRGRKDGQFSRQEFERNFVGQDAWNMTVSLSDNEEAYVYYATAQNAIAQVPLLQAEIVELEKQVGAEYQVATVYTKKEK